MEPSTLLTAVVTGVTVALQDAAGQTVREAYNGLKAFLIDSFSIGSIATLEKSPSDEDFKKSFEKEVSLTPELLTNERVKILITELYAAIETEHTPSDLLSIGVDIKKIKSEKNTVLRDISGFDKGIKSDSIESGQDTIIENITGKSKA